MTSQPDSALNVILSLNDSTDEQEMSVPDRHEFNILLAEALYKNDYLQVNDSAIELAVQFYDSICERFPNNLDLQFQRARAFYYRGVGYSEKDKIVEACESYLTALQLMETYFREEDLNKDRLRFMALINSRLGQLFYNESLYAQSIESCKKSANLFNYVGDTESVISVIAFLGNVYHIVNKVDSAMICYQWGHKMIASDKSIIGRDVKKGIASVYHEKGMTDTAIMIMREILPLACGDEKMIYEYTIGEMYYCNNQIDSALYYLRKSFLREDKYTKMASSKILSDIHESKGDEDSCFYYKKYFSESATDEIGNRKGLK